MNMSIGRARSLFDKIATSFRLMTYILGGMAKPYDAVLVLTHANALAERKLICNRLNLAGIRTFISSDIPFWKNKSTFRRRIMERAVAIIVIQNDDLPKAAWSTLIDVESFKRSPPKNALKLSLFIVTKLANDVVDFTTHLDADSSPEEIEVDVPYANLSFRFANTPARLRFGKEMLQKLDIITHSSESARTTLEPIYFAPNECRVITNPFSREVVVEYFRPLDIEVDHIQFDSDSSRAFLVTPVGRRYDIGIIFGEYERLAWSASSDVALIRMSNGTRVAGVLKLLLQTKRIGDVSDVHKMLIPVTNSMR